MKHTEISIIHENKKQYLPLLLLADEQEDMIDRYIDRGDMYAMSCNGETVCICVVTDEGENVCEIKNIATAPLFQQQGYGRKMIDFVINRYRSTHRTLQVGTGKVPSTSGFYTKCGFVFSHRVKDFFTDNYNKPIIEDGIVLKDMIYFKREICQE